MATLIDWARQLKQKRDKWKAGYSSDVVVFDTMIGYRSRNGIAFTIEYPDWIDDSIRKIEIIDAQYRPSNSLAFGTYGIDSSNPNINQLNFYPFLHTLSPINDIPTNYTLTEAKSNTNFNFSIDLTATELYNTWRTYGETQDNTPTNKKGPITGVPAVTACDSITIDGGKWKLPNIYQLFICWLWSDIVDSQDPTTDSYPALKIGKTHTNGRFRSGTFWSSTEHSNGYCRSVSYGGQIDSDYKYSLWYVLPIREL